MIISFISFYSYEMEEKQRKELIKYKEENLIKNHEKMIDEMVDEEENIKMIIKNLINEMIHQIEK